MTVTRSDAYSATLWRTARSISPSVWVSVTFAPWLRPNPGRGRREGPRTDAVAEVGAFIPDRIPQALGHARHVGMTLVDQRDVDIAVRAKFVPAVPAHRDQGQAVRLRPHVAEETLQPCIH